MAAINKLGDIFLVDDGSSPYTASLRLAALPDGRFTALWESTSASYNDPENPDYFTPNPLGADIKGQLFAVDGSKLGGAFTVSDAPTTQSGTAVAAIGDQGILTAWVARRDNVAEIEGQIITASGADIGHNFQINSAAYGLQWQPALTAIGDHFLASWTTQDPAADGSGSAIKAQLLDAGGGRIGGEFLVNGQGLGDQKESVTVALQDGRFALFWASTDHLGLPEDTDYDIKGRFFDAQGNPMGAELRINGSWEAAQHSPAAAVLLSGDVVVVWASDSADDGDAAAIKGRLYAADGTPRGEEFLVNTKGAGSQLDPVVAAVGSGFVVAWDTRAGTGDYSGVSAQAFDASGAKLGDETLVSDTSGDYVSQSDPSIADLGSGKFAISWKATSIPPFGMPGAYDNYLGQILQAVPGAIGAATPGDDTISGSTSDDNIAALGGDDDVHGQAGSDRLSGNDGNDTLHGDAGDDSLNGNAGNDLLFGDDGADLLYGDVGADDLHGGEGADKLSGQDGADTLSGDAGDDLLFGGTGSDAADGGAGADTVHGDAGIDRLRGGEGDDRIAGGDDRDYLYGDAGRDVLFGDGGDDQLYGGGDADRLVGGGGDDFLNGGQANDTLNGGAGDDSFYLYFGPTTAGVDRIEDFTSGEDRIALSARGFGLPAGALDPAAYSVGPGPPGTAPGFWFDPSGRTLYWDSDGTGAHSSLALATFAGQARPAAGDFYLI